MENIVKKFDEFINENKHMNSNGEKIKYESDWGFDLTTFKPGMFKKLLNILNLPDNAKKFNSSWYWESNDITIVTGNNPITGEFGSDVGRKNEIDYASYIGISGNKDMVKKAADFIKKHATHQGESKNKRDYI